MALFYYFMTELYSFLYIVCVCVCVCACVHEHSVAQLCPIPMDCHQASLSMKLSRQEY